MPNLPPGAVIVMDPAPYHSVKTGNQDFSPGKAICKPAHRERRSMDPGHAETGVVPAGEGPQPPPPPLPAS